MAQSSSPILRFFGAIWKIVSIIIRVCVSVFVLAIIAAVVIGLVVPSGPRVPKKAALVWSPQGNIVESVSRGPKALIRETLGEAPRQTSLAELKVALERGAADDRIKLAVLKLDGMGHVGMAQLQGLRKAIKNFEASGKEVIAYAPSYNQKAYYLAAQADKVYMSPMGSVLLRGFGMYPMYFKDALNTLKVRVHVFRRGRYKSAVEPFIRNDMSPAAKRETAAWLGDLWDVYIKDVASSRGLQTESLNAYANHLPKRLTQADGDGAKVAKKAGLVDGLITPAQLRSMVEKTVGENSKTGSFHQIDDREYVQASGGVYARKTKQKIGLIVAEGDIVDGKSSPGKVGGDTLAGKLRRARANPDIAAVVLRVDSPGGSVTASAKIRQALIALRKSGKPVVVSMSSLAASGGYWISMNANQIWAQPTTITGSIGIFGIIPNFSQSLNTLGIHSDGVGTNHFTGALRMDHPLDPRVAQAIQAVINNGYHHFITNVAHARGLTVEQVDAIGEGHVWSGVTAKKLGLVDHLGGLSQAIQAATQLAHLKGNPQVYPIRRKRSLSEQFLAAAGQVSAKLGVGRALPMPSWVRQLLQRRARLADFSWMNDPRNVYAYCFCRPNLGSNTAP